VPRLPDRYFQSRLISDMASRAHALQLLRELPAVAGLAGSLAGTLLFTAGAIAWLYPGAALPAVAAAVAAVAVPLLFRRPLLERDLRVRESGAALSRFHLDALLGACAIQAHAAEPALMHAHARQLDGWVAAGLRRQALIVAAEAIQSALSIACVVWLIVGQAAAGWHAGLLLLTFWAVSIPAIGAELATVLWSLPLLRNTILRCLEPLGSPELDVGAAAPPDAPSAGVSVDIDDVTVLAGGHTVLDRVTLRIAPGEHVAIVGPSGSGKSSLVGLLLGWHEPAEGRLLVDRQPLSSAARAALRQTTAWIDPQVHLFKTSVFENVRFGQNDAAGDTAAEAGDAALVDLLRRLPDGLQTLVGDRGGALSAGEGQRIRIARALARRDARLAVLDEPARGLNRDRRRQLLADARRHFRTATVLAITHDLSDTLDFDRVVVLDSGRILEHGTPAVLAADPMSRYASLLAEERAVRQDVWSHPRWRRLRMEKGTLREAAEERTWTLV
jgi:ATP-binding cassette subfamily B protein